MRSVRSRVAVVLGLVVLVPAVVALVAIGVLAPLQQLRTAQNETRSMSTALGSRLVDQCRVLGATARSLGLDVRDGDPGTATADAVRRQHGLFAAVVRGGRVVASAGPLPDVAVSTLTTGSCGVVAGAGALAGGTPDRVPVLVQQLPVPTASGQVTALVGQELAPAQLHDQAGLAGLSTRLEVAVVCPDGSGVSTATGAGVGTTLLRLAAAGGGQRTVDGWVVTPAPGELRAPCRVLAAERVRTLAATLPWVVAALLLVLLLGGWLVVRLAGSLTRPVLGLTEAAERVARGDLSQRLPPAGRDELGRLSNAFNVMTEELALKIGELERSRDLLRENVSRLGDTLQRTHDLDGLLSTVLQAAASATDAQRATAWLVEGESVVARVSVPAGAPRSQVRRLALGADLAGEVAADGVARRLGHGHGDTTTALTGAALAAPLRRGHQTIGVVVVEREPSHPDFGADDEQMLTSLAGPAGIAVDNVMLHREAQRLSVTDPLTGAGNLRHMTTTLAREVERSTRFDRPLSVLLLDLDHFKNVNDTYGHTVGDAVLRELARRLASCVREVDTVARYGGEEFVVVTPETDTLGAEHLAERICEAVREEPFVVGNDVVVVTVSVGVASLPIHGTASGDLVRAADEGLYAAKRGGRDQWRVAPGGEVRVDR